MAFSPNPKDATIAISVFGGLVTEEAPPDLPEGVSPDCQDNIFQPGNVSSREALEKVFAQEFPVIAPATLIPSVVYGKSYAGPTGAIANLYLDSNGILWLENLSSPGFYTQLSTLLGQWAKSCTAFGREYIAASDGLHGTDIPLQWDGTNLDRVTQDGPGAPPNVASIALPSVSMVATGSTVLALTESDPSGFAPINPTAINTWTANDVSGLSAGGSLTIAGYTGDSAYMNGTWTITNIIPNWGTGGYLNLIQLSAALPATAVFSTSPATGTFASGTMVRQGNVVTVNCATPHGLLVGYQALIAGVGASIVGTGISSIVIDNENNPGVATVTTSTPHGLLPNNFVSIAGVAEVIVGIAITSATWEGGLVTVVTSSAHGLTPGCLVTIAATGGTSGAFNGSFIVLSVPSTESFTYALVPLTAPSPASGGTVSLNWPITDTPTPTYFEVLSSPTPTTFQVAINYSDGTWTSGAASFAWDGTFYVSTVVSPTVFQYQQYGPNANTSSVGTATPFGQAAPGIHQCQVLFLTRQGAITAPSPPVQFEAAGGQYVSISNLPIGPPNIVGRILAFTGAEGATYFYIPSTPQVNGQIVGTSTQINDNATTAVVLDFSDPTLFSATGISIPGNNIVNQIVFDSVLAFRYYAGRLIALGMRNRIQNFLNLSFDGGQFYNSPGSTASNFPCGWTVGTGASGGGKLTTTGRWGWAWQATGAGSIYQGAFEDAYGAPILTGNTPYTFRVWIGPGLASATITLTISSASTGFSSSATVNGATIAGFQQANFSETMPAAIPVDMILTLTWTGTPLFDEISVIYQDNPYLDAFAYQSYVDNPEAFDGVTGKLGSAQDSHKIMDIANLRETLYLLTQDPGGRLHETSDNGTTEPSGWTVNEVAANCGLLSAFGLTKSQADDSSSAGGEEWFAWASSSGARIFGGSDPMKISQEIQPDWQDINPAFNVGVWALNDPVARRIYFGLPLAGVSAGAASKIYMVDYRGLNTANEIGNTGPIRIGFSGKLIATDHARKWSRWNLAINGAALMYRQSGALQPVFFAGNGQEPGVAASYGNVYTLNPAKLTDDDYGQIYPYYVTFFMPGHDEEQAFQLGGGRKLLAYLQAFISGVGTLTIIPLCDALTNPWSLTGTRALTANPKFDLEWPGGEAQAQRIALKFASGPTSGTDNGFNLQKVVATIRKAARLPVRGSAS